MKIKPGAIFSLRAPMIYACAVVEEVYQRHGVECIFTSGNDGKHSDNSLHYDDSAADFRTRTIPQEKLPLIFNQIKQRLGNDYDVVLEKTHLHVEHDPKG